MNVETFQHFLTGIVIPMFPGATLNSSSYVPRRARSKVVVFEKPTQLKVCQNLAAKEFYSINRLQGWWDSEIRLMEKLIGVFDQTASSAGSLLGQLEDFMVRRAIAETIAAGEQEQTLQIILQTLSDWSSQTYEGERVSSGIVISSNHSSTNLSLLSVMKEDFGKILSDGVDSWWDVDSGGRIMQFETIDPRRPVSPERKRSQPDFFPLRYGALASKSNNGNIGLTLNRNGEILVFYQGKLKFAKRRGKWLHFTHDPVVTRMQSGWSLVELRQSVYESSLDASFARSGACIGIVTKQKMAEFKRTSPIAIEDLLSNSSGKLKPGCAAQLICNRPFPQIPRLVRKELLGLDGALVLQWDGVVLAAGAILELAGVRRENQGGRSAAAKALSNFGIGIKVSEDGMISGYKDGKDQPVFELG